MIYLLSTSVPICRQWIPNQLSSKYRFEMLQNILFQDGPGYLHDAGKWECQVAGGWKRLDGMN